MTSIRKDIRLGARSGDVWDAVRDFGAVHRRLAPGFAADCRLDGNARVVTFHTGVVAREELVDCDEARRRLVYAIVGGERVKHYNGAVQVFDDGDRRCQILWTIDVLPNEVATYIESQMDLAVIAMRKALEQGNASGAPL
jgi:Polyketide cyclase / dehydrase and lipid transport